MCARPWALGTAPTGTPGSPARAHLLQAGIVDPAKVVRTALQNAASLAGLLVTTEAMVAETPKNDAAPSMPGDGMGGF